MVKECFQFFYRFPICNLDFDIKPKLLFSISKFFSPQLNKMLLFPDVVYQLNIDLLIVQNFFNK
jgi:hypothetical protein